MVTAWLAILAQILLVHSALGARPSPCGTVEGVVSELGPMAGNENGEALIRVLVDHAADGEPFTLRRVQRLDDKTMNKENVLTSFQRALAKGWIAPGSATHSFVLTESGKQAARDYRTQQLKPMRPNVEIAGRKSDEALQRALPELVQAGQLVADVGAAHGQRALVSARKGASVDAIEIHNPTLEIAKKNFAAEPSQISSRVKPVLSDFFNHAQLKEKSYDWIVFSPPRLNEKTAALQADWLRIIEDPGFKLLDRFLSESKPRLSKTGKILMAYGYEDGVEQGHVYFGGRQTLEAVAAKHGLSVTRLENHSFAEDEYGVYVLAPVEK